MNYKKYTMLCLTIVGTLYLSTLFARQSRGGGASGGFGGGAGANFGGGNPGGGNARFNASGGGNMGKAAGINARNNNQQQQNAAMIGAAAAAGNSSSTGSDSSGTNSSTPTDSSSTQPSMMQDAGMPQQAPMANVDGMAPMENNGMMAANQVASNQATPMNMQQGPVAGTDQTMQNNQSNEPQAIDSLLTSPTATSDIPDQDKILETLQILDEYNNHSKSLLANDSLQQLFNNFVYFKNFIVSNFPKAKMLELCVELINQIYPEEQTTTLKTHGSTAENESSSNDANNNPQPADITMTEMEQNAQNAAYQQHMNDENAEQQAYFSSQDHDMNAQAMMNPEEESAVYQDQNFEQPQESYADMNEESSMDNSMNQNTNDMDNVNEQNMSFDEEQQS